jgi:hypothetical protein
VLFEASINIGVAYQVWCFDFLLVWFSQQVSCHLWMTVDKCGGRLVRPELSPGFSTFAAEKFFDAG